CFERGSVVDLTVESGVIEEDERRIYVSVEPGVRCLIRTRTASGHAVTICTLTRAEALGLWKVDVWGQERLILSDADLLVSAGRAELRSAGRPEMRLSVSPDVAGSLFGPYGRLERTADGLFTDYRVALPAQDIPLSVTHISAAKAVVGLPADAFRDVAD